MVMWQLASLMFDLSVGAFAPICESDSGGEVDALLQPFLPGLRCWRT